MNDRSTSSCTWPSSSCGGSFSQAVLAEGSSSTEQPRRKGPSTGEGERFQHSRTIASKRVPRPGRLTGFSTNPITNEAVFGNGQLDDGGTVAVAARVGYQMHLGLFGVREGCDGGIWVRGDGVIGHRPTGGRCDGDLQVIESDFFFNFFFPFFFFSYRRI